MLKSGEIFVVDDDPAVCDALAVILLNKGYSVSAFSDGDSFLAAALTRRPACVLLDVRLPGRSGLDSLKELTARGYGVPIIVISGQRDIPTAVKAIQSGAFDFIEKPFNADTVTRRVSEAIAASATQRIATGASGFLDVLTARECDVLEQILAGASTKEAARQLGNSPRTVELHRMRILKKMGAKNTAELARIALTRPKNH